MMEEEIHLIVPPLFSIKQEIERIFNQTGQVGLLYLRVVELRGSDEKWEMVFKEATGILRELRGEIFRRNDLIAIHERGLVIILSPPRTRPKLLPDHLRKVRTRILENLAEKMEKRFGYYESQFHGLYMGWGLVETKEGVPFDELLDGGIKDALGMAISEEYYANFKGRVGTKGPVSNKKVPLVFQPIAHLKGDEILGYEVINRYPKVEATEYPKTYFALAARGEVHWAIEEILRRKSLLDELELTHGRMLLIHVHSLPFDMGDLGGSLEKIGLAPERVTIGLSIELERETPDEFKETVNRLKKVGVKVLIDEVGEKEDIEKAVQCHPEFIRFDIPMIRDIDKVELRQNLLKEEILHLTKEGITPIALGIRGADEFRVLSGLGVEYGEELFEGEFDMAVWQESAEVEERSRYFVIRETGGLISVPFGTLSLRRILDTKGQIGVLYLNIVKHTRELGVYDWPVWDLVLKSMADCLLDGKGHIFRREDTISVYQDERHNLILLLSPPRIKPAFEGKDLEVLGGRIKEYVRMKVAQKVSGYYQQGFGVYVGYGVVENTPGVFAEALVSEAIERAARSAIDRQQYERWLDVARLKKIISERQIHILFQPIVSLVEGKIHGYEAFSRGPEKSALESPGVLFSLAKEADLSWMLERICQEKALVWSTKMKEDERLFLNTDPKIVNDPRFKGIEFPRHVPLKPENIVIEMSQHMATTEAALFRCAVEEFRSKGFGIAIDEVGSALEQIQSIVALNPDYIKIDISLVQEIDKDPIRQDLVKTLVKVARQRSLKVIAVGIEREEEYRILSSLEVDYGQGYFIGRPEEGLPGKIYQWGMQE